MSGRLYAKKTKVVHPSHPKDNVLTYIGLPRAQPLSPHSFRSRHLDSLLWRILYNGQTRRTSQNGRCMALPPRLRLTTTMASSHQCNKLFALLRPHRFLCEMTRRPMTCALVGRRTCICQPLHTPLPLARSRMAPHRCLPSFHLLA
jgi:hypothetical protein